MFVHILNAKYTSGYKVWIKFDDGIEGEVDLQDQLWGEMFAPLTDKTLFKTVKFDKNMGTIVWSNGADLSPEFLHDRLI